MNNKLILVNYEKGNFFSFYFPSLVEILTINYLFLANLMAKNNILLLFDNYVS